MSAPKFLSKELESVGVFAASMGIPHDPLKIRVVVVQQYGQEVVKPVCEKANLFAVIAGTKTLTRQTITLIKQLGYKIEVVPTEPKEL